MPEDSHQLRFPRARPSDPDQDAPPPFRQRESGNSGGFVASQVHIGSYQDRMCTDTPSERQTNSLAARLERRPKYDTRQIVAHSLEFVALPGRAEGIQAEIPIAMGHAFSGIEGFVGCMVLVSEQETRLVTVITLWSGSNRLALCNESGARLRKWLSPYVDRWLRTRTYASFVTAPGRFAADSNFQEAIVATAAPLQ